MNSSLYILLASFLWALDSLIRYPLMQNGASAIQIIFYEHLILVLFFLPFGIKNFKLLLNKKLLSDFLIVGGIGSAIGTLAFTQAFYWLNPSIVILLQKLQPIVAVLFAAYFLKEKIKLPFLFWAGWCLVGSFLISFEDLMPIFSSSYSVLKSGTIMGYFLTLIAVIGWGSSTVFGKRLAINGVNEQQIMLGRFVVGFLISIPFLFFSQSNILVGTSQLVKIAVMAIVSGLIALYFYYRGLRKISARLCTLLEMSFPLFAVLLNWFFLDASLSFYQILGGIILLLSAALIQIKGY